MNNESTLPMRPPEAVQSDVEVLRHARQILQMESSALEQLVHSLDDQFVRAARLLHRLHGNLIVTGMGKAGLIGQKLTCHLCLDWYQSPLSAPG